jgi:hypothetical protein
LLCAGVWAFFFLISFGLMTHQWASSEEPPAGETCFKKIIVFAHGNSQWLLVFFANVGYHRIC